MKPRSQITWNPTDGYEVWAFVPTRRITARTLALGWSAAPRRQWCRIAGFGGRRPIELATAFPEAHAFARRYYREPVLVAPLGPSTRIPSVAKSP